jgi:SAM-dependent methyltransferase
LGAGRCWASRYFSRFGCNVVSLDILLTKYVGLLTSDIYIKNENIYFERILSDMNYLPFNEKIFDYVFVSASLHHSLDLLKTLREINRVLKHNGKFIVINEPVRGLFKNNRNDNEEIRVGINEKDYRLREYLMLLKEAGFDYNLEFWLGGNNKLINSVNRLSTRLIKKEKVNKIIWDQIKYLQLVVKGGVLNMFAYPND